MHSHTHAQTHTCTHTHVFHRMLCFTWVVKGIRSLFLTLSLAQWTSLNNVALHVAIFQSLSPAPTSVHFPQKVGLKFCNGFLRKEESVPTICRESFDSFLSKANLYQRTNFGFFALLPTQQYQREYSLWRNMMDVFDQNCFTFRTCFPSTEANLLLWLYISVLSRDLPQQTDDPACFTFGQRQGGLVTSQSYSFFFQIPYFSNEAQGMKMWWYSCSSSLLLTNPHTISPVFFSFYPVCVFNPSFINFR
jgi:hypothetical protein